MFRALLFVALLGLAAASSADGPGSRIRAGSGVPQPAGPNAGPLDKDLQRCDALRGDAKERCMREVRAAASAPERPPHEGPGPASTGAGSAAGSGGAASGRK